jgi:hypothetical protein
MYNNLMSLAMRSTVLVCLSSALGHAETWSGTLVDSRCWDFQENNTKDTSIYVDRDTNMELHICSPTAKTKSFTVVLPDGSTLKLNTGGNAKAAELVQKIGKRSPVTVGITGESERNTVRVDSISMLR